MSKNYEDMNAEERDAEIKELNSCQDKSNVCIVTCMFIFIILAVVSLFKSNEWGGLITTSAMMLLLLLIMTMRKVKIDRLEKLNNLENTE